MSQVKSSQVHHYLTLCVMMLLAACQNPKNELLPQEVKAQEVKGGKSTEVQANAQQANTQRVARTGISYLNGRLVFADAEAFHNTLTAISSTSSEEVQAFEQTFVGYTSWRKYNQDNINNEEVEPLYYSKTEPALPSFYTTLINSNKEYQIGNTIFYLEEGKVYFIPQSQEETLRKKGKFNAIDLVNIPTDIIKTNIHSPDAPEDNTEARIVDAKYQYQYNHGGHTYKQVFEVASTSIPYNGGLNGAYFYINQKLEYWFSRWNRREWRVAGDVRTTNIIDMTGYVSFIGISGGSAWYFSNPFNNTLTNRAFDTTVLLRGVVGNGLNINNFQFNLRVSDMSMFVPSHGQCATGCPNPYLRQIPARWSK